jgi:hypothetical protein
MTLFIQTPVNSRIFQPPVESDIPSVCGILFNMGQKLCNKCGLHPKYPGQGICKKCVAEKKHQEWVTSRPEKLPIPDLPNEKWQDLIEANGYQISNYGRVKSLNYYDEPGRHYILKLREARKGGYLKADIDKHNWRPSVHRLVAMYFIPNPEILPLVLHKDNNKQNNHYSNLYWGTFSKNRQDYIEHTIKTGISRKQMPKNQVLEIFNSPLSTQQLALKFSIETSTVWMIKSGYRWSKITGAIKNDKRTTKTIR